VHIVAQFTRHAQVAIATDPGDDTSFAQFAPGNISPAPRELSYLPPKTKYLLSANNYPIKPLNGFPKVMYLAVHKRAGCIFIGVSQP
jgi:hypothetical protein